VFGDMSVQSLAGFDGSLTSPFTLPRQAVVLKLRDAPYRHFADGGGVHLRFNG
jgi:hypothetical protein